MQYGTIRAFLIAVTYGVSMTISFQATRPLRFGGNRIARVGGVGYRTWRAELSFLKSRRVDLRAHFTMDVFTGIMTGLCCPLAGLISTTLRGNKDPGDLKSKDGLERITEQPSNSGQHVSKSRTDRDYTNAVRMREDSSRT